MISDQTSLHLFSIPSQESFYFEGLYFSDVKKCRHNKGNEGGFCLRRGKRKSMYVVKMTSSSYFSCILMSYFIGFFYHHHHHRLLLFLKGYLYTWTVGYDSIQRVHCCNVPTKHFKFCYQFWNTKTRLVNIPVEHFKKHKWSFFWRVPIRIALFLLLNSPLSIAIPISYFFRMNGSYCSSKCKEW